MKHRIALLFSVAGVLLCAAAQAEAPTPTPVSAAAPGALDAGAAARFAALALKCLHQEYPTMSRTRSTVRRTCARRMS